MSVKQERVAQIILKDVTDIIQFSLKDPSVGSSRLLTCR